MKFNLYRFKDGMEIFPSNKYRIVEEGDEVKLVVKNLHEGDKGEITCELSNAKGKESATVKLGVQGEWKQSKLPDRSFNNMKSEF